MSTGYARPPVVRKIVPRLSGYKPRPPRSKVAWRKWYEEYRASPEWAAVRGAVVERADGRCEGCSGPGAEVHHASYEHVGHEFLFELLLLCRPCHARWHKKGRSAEPPGLLDYEPTDGADEAMANEGRALGAAGLLAALEALK